MSNLLWLMRHGETEWSRSGQHTSRTDLPLTAEGEQRASDLARRLVGRRFALVLSSPMRRALETCRLAGYTPEIADDLHEWDYGAYEGLTTAEIQRTAPGLDHLDRRPAGRRDHRPGERAGGPDYRKGPGRGGGRRAVQPRTHAARPGGAVAASGAGIGSAARAFHRFRQRAGLGTRDARPPVVEPDRHNRRVRPRLWLWPNLLSLDAPLVAVLWQVLFLRCFHVPGAALPAVLLVSAVWLIYAADRALDSWRGAGSRPRHEFYRRHWRAVLPVWAGVFSVAACLAWTSLSPILRARGLWLCAAVVLYFAAVHLLPLRWPKEAAVAVLFALGASLAAWTSVRTPSDVLTVLLFCCLCWINCMAIEQCEQGLASLARGRASGRCGPGGPSAPFRAASDPRLR